MGHHYDRGTMLFNLGRYREAVAEFTAELGEDPRSIEAYGMRGMCHLKLREFKECQRDIEEAISIDPEWSYSFYVLSIASLAKNRTRDAARHIEEALRIDRSPAYFYQLAAVEFSRERLDPVLKATEAALALNPRDVDNLVLRAKLLSKVGRLDEARRLLETALAIEPERPGTHRELGSINLLRGSADRALGHLVEARRIDPVRYNERRLLASAYGQLWSPFKQLASLKGWLAQGGPLVRWACLAGVMTLLVVTMVVTGTGDGTFSWGAASLFAAVTNGLLLLATFPSFATVAALVALRRELDTRWYDYPRGLVELVAMLLAHVAIAGVGLFLSLFAGLTYMLFALVLLNWDLFWLLSRIHLVVVVLLLPVVGFGSIVLSLGGAVGIPRDAGTVTLNWLVVLVASLGLALIRRRLEHRVSPQNDMEVVTL